MADHEAASTMSLEAATVKSVGFMLQTAFLDPRNVLEHVVRAMKWVIDETLPVIANVHGFCRVCILYSGEHTD